jgi:hypothetical protein
MAVYEKEGSKTYHLRPNCPRLLHVGKFARIIEKRDERSAGKHRCAICERRYAATPDKSGETE